MSIDFGAQLLAVAAVLLVAMLGPVIALAFLIVRKRHARAARRSPLTADLLRAPGETLREQVDELRYDIGADVAILMVVPLLLVSTHLAQSYLLGAPERPFRTGLILLVGLTFVGGMTWRMLSRSRRLDTLRIGLDAEVAAGQELDQLMRQGAAVFHDFAADDFNIDHVVIAKQGVYAVETKGRTKSNSMAGKEGATVEYDGRALRFPSWVESKPVEQAQRQAQWMERWLSSATGSPISVTAVLALPGWFVDRKGRGPVRVYSGRELGGLLGARGVKGLTADEVQRAVHQVEQRCRDVKPTYRWEDT